MARVRFGVLGALEVVSDGVRLRVGGARRMRLLAVLLVEAGRVVPLPRLIDAVWDEQPPPTAKTQVHKIVSRLRQLIGAEVLVSDPAGYRFQLGDDAALDAWEFVDHVQRADRAGEQDRLAEAAASARAGLSLWRGPALAGVGGSVVRAAAQRLDEQRLAVLERCLNWELELGQHAQVVAELTELVAEHPLRERLRGQLMLALHRVGRQADALEIYEHGRRILAEDLGLDPDPELRAIHQQVLSADSVATVSDAVRSPVPRQLPAPPPMFVGRHAELADLNKALNAHTVPGGTVVISAIGGAGGIGKTVLAVHWAHHNIDRFPDGQLHINLRGFDPSGAPTPPDTAVRNFLHALGVPAAAVPPGLDAQVGLYRSLLADKRMLVLLDNAVDTAQIEPLLPGTTTCTVLVTSRNHLAGLRVRGAHLVDLDVLTPDEAHILMIRRLPQHQAAADPAALADLLSYCGGVPLAISIVAARATQHPDFPLTVLADELHDTTTRLDALNAGELTTNMRTVFSWSYHALAPAAAHMFRLLGLAPGPDISLPAAANLAALPTTHTRTLLRDLETAHLVTQHTPGRYRMHDLTRLYATDRAHHDTPNPDRQQALHRLIDYYLHTAHTANRHLHPHRPPIQLDPPVPGTHPHSVPDTPAALAWFDTEHPNLLAAQHTATTHDWHHTVWQLAWTLYTIHDRRGHFHDRLAVWQAALDAAAHLPDPTTHIHAHRYLGSAYADLGQHEEAIGHLHQALALAEHHHDATHQADTHHALARAWGLRGDDWRALNHATRALHRYRALGQPVRHACALNAVGWFAARLGEYNTAREHCQAALTLLQDHHNPTGDAETLDSLGYIDHRTGHHHNAIDHYQQALTLFRDLGDTYESANTLDKLGHPHAALGQHNQARAVWQRALHLYQAQHRTTDVDRIQQQLTSLPAEMEA